MGRRRAPAGRPFSLLCPSIPSDYRRVDSEESRTEGGWDARSSQLRTLVHVTPVAPWLADAVSHASFGYVALATVLWFAAIYTLIAGGAFVFAVERLPGAVAAPGGFSQRLRAGQVGRELWLSAASILVFAAQATVLLWILRRGWLAIAWDRPVWYLIWEMPVLYVWNEVHFFVVHRLLHVGPLYRRIHVWHHRSVVTTPFSAYSFHPIESFLLGSVMPLALVFHAFSPWALLGLTVMSLCSTSAVIFRTSACGPCSGSRFRTAATTTDTTASSTPTSDSRSRRWTIGAGARATSRPRGRRPDAHAHAPLQRGVRHRDRRLLPG